MVRVRGIKLLNRELFIETLLIWCLLNSTVPLKCNPYAQYVALMFALWAFFILLFDLKYRPQSLFVFPNASLFIVFTLIAVLSSIRAFIVENAGGTIQNVYALIALVINIFIVYNNRLNLKSYIRFLKLGYILSLVIVVLSHITLLLHLSIEVPNSDGKIFTIGIERGENRFTGLLGNPNDLGRMALFGMLCLILYWNISEIKHQLRWSISLILFWLCIMMSQSRGVIYSLYVAILVAGMIITCVKYRRDHMPLLGKIGVLVVVFFFWLSMAIVSEMATKTYSHFANYIENKIITEVEKTDTFVGMTSENGVVMIEERVDTGKGFSTGRSFLIKLGVNTTMDYSLLAGLTPGNSKRLCANYMNHSWNVTQAPSAAIGNTHNTWIQSFVNYGIVAFFILFLITVNIFLRIIKWTLFSGYESKGHKEKFAVLAAIFSLLILALVENVFLYSFENEPINLLFMLSMGQVMFFQNISRRGIKECDDTGKVK